MVTSSLKEISTDELRNRVVVRGEALQQAYGQILKDDVNVFPPTRAFASWK